MMVVFVVWNGAEIDSAWSDETSAKWRASELNEAHGGLSLGWSVVETPWERNGDGGASTRIARA